MIDRRWCDLHGNYASTVLAKTNSPFLGNSAVVGDLEINMVQGVVGARFVIFGIDGTAFNLRDDKIRT